MFHGLAETGKDVFARSVTMDEAERCDELVLMRDGLIVEKAAAPAELLARTAA